MHRRSVCVEWCGGRGVPAFVVSLALGMAASPVLAAPLLSASAGGARQQKASARRALVGQRSPAGAVTDSVQRGLTALADSLIASGLERYEIAGAAFARVEGGRIAHLRGFGLADLEREVPVDPRAIRFHIASVTKLFTTISVLQQVERGRLSLDDDVNRHLGDGFVPDRFGEPVRVRHLLTHTSGLGVRWTGIAATSPDGVRPLDAFLRGNLPPRVEPPGVAMRYSNFGFALAGRIVEVASGMPYDRYVEENIMRPLGMERAYVSPRAPDGDDAVGYFYRERITAEPRIFEHISPAGGVHATAEDMARLMGALLAGGEWEGRRILADSTVGLMFETQFTGHPALPGHTFGLFERPTSSERGLMIGGEVPGFSARMLLLPDRGVGFFLAVNRKDPLLAMRVFGRLVERLSAPAGAVAADSATARTATVSSVEDGPSTAGRPPLRAFTGDYRYNAYAAEGFLRTGALFNPRISVRSGAGGGLEVDFAGLPRRAETWSRVGPRLFEAEDGARYAFRLDADRRATHLFVQHPVFGPAAFERTSWYAAPGFVLGAFGVCGGVFLFAALAIPIAAVVRRRRRARGRAGVRVEPLAVRLRLASWSLAALAILFVPAFAWGLAQLAVVRDDRFAFGVPWWMDAVLSVPLLTLGLTIVLAVMVARAWHTPRGTRAARAGHTLIVASAGAFHVLLWYWGLLGPAM